MKLIDNRKKIVRYIIVPNNIRIKHFIFEIKVQNMNNIVFPA